MDYKAAKRVQQLLNDITDGTKHSSLANNADNVAELKSTLKHNPQDVEYLTPLLLDRLAANHSQVLSLRTCQRCVSCSTPSLMTNEAPCKAHKLACSVATVA